MQVSISKGRERAKRNLFATLQPFLMPYKISRKKVFEAIEKAFGELGETWGNVQPETMSIILGMIFGSDVILWISPQTPAGNITSLDVMVTAYALWGDAQSVALRRGMDSVDAAEALTNVVYQLADRISEGAAPEINNIRKYLFVSYARALSRIAENAGILSPCDQVKKINPSDNGAFIEELENAILCHDLLRTMPLKVRKAVILRHVKGYSCMETAEAVGMSNNATRKTIHANFKKARETCMRELKRMGVTKMNNSNTSNKAAHNDR